MGCIVKESVYWKHLHLEGWNAEVAMAWHQGQGYAVFGCPVVFLPSKKAGLTQGASLPCKPVSHGFLNLPHILISHFLPLITMVLSITLLLMQTKHHLLSVLMQKF